jgi:hypothetical protein
MSREIVNQEILEKGRLLKTNRIRIDKVFSIEKSLIQLKIGRLNRETFDKVRKEFFSLI